ncbi:MAG: PQQ-binding-like beta-propeller repeat protein, partial [Dehalococcoidia bacterium]
MAWGKVGEWEQGMLVVGSRAEHEVVALSPDGGRLIWSFPRDFEGLQDLDDAVGIIYGTPVIEGDAVYFASYTGKVYARNLADGKAIWHYPVGKRKYIDSIIGGPAIAGDTLFIGSSNGKLYALDAATGAARWPAPFEMGGKIWGTPTVV